MMIRIKGIRLNIKPIIVLPMILILLFVCMPVVPVSASSPPLLPGDTVTPVGGSSITVSGISDYLIWLTEHATAGLENKAEKWYQETFKGGSDICSSSNALNGRHNFVQQYTQVDGKTGTFYVCEYCGQSAGEVGEAAYQDYVSDLPAHGISSDGVFLWTPSFFDMTECKFTAGDSWRLFNVLPGTYEYLCPQDMSSLKVATDGMSAQIVYMRSDHDRLIALGAHPFTFALPIEGIYSLHDSLLGSFYWEKISGSSGSYDYYYPVLRSVYKYAGDTMTIDEHINYFPDSRGGFSYCSGIMYPPTYEVIPFGGVFDCMEGVTYNDKTIYNVDSRPTSISGDLAYYNTNGDLMVAPSSTVVNETDNSVYNPVTNTSYDMSSWDYDYSTRTYNVNYQTTDASTGDVIDNSMSITYGDENISIVDGGTTYTVYYVTNYNGSGDDGGSGGNGGSDTPVPTAAPSGSVPIYDHDLPAGRSSFGQKLLAFFRDLPDLFADMTEFLKTGWGYIPDEITYFIEFGVAMAVLVGIFKLFFR